MPDRGQHIPVLQDPLARILLAVWAALLAVKLAIALMLPPFGDEAFYWQEGRHLAWAYSDLPGATAWLARLGVALGGDTLLGLRWPFLLLGALVPWLVARIAAREFGAQAGWRAGILAALLPLAGTLGVLALPDVPLTFAAVLCLDAGMRLLRGVSWRACLWLALGLALGAFSHYRFALVVIAGLAGLLLSRQGRAALRDARVWAALAFGALAWLPLLLWNLAHGDAGLRFQLVDRHPWSFHADGAAYPLVQALCVTPLLLLALIATLREGWRRRGDAVWALLFGAGAVPVLGYFALGFFADSERVSFHWPLPGWLALCVAAPPVLARWPRMWRGATYALAALGTVAAFAWLGVAATPSLRAALADGRGYPDNFAGWREIAAAARERLARMPPGTRLVADNFMLGAQLGFARGDADIAVLEHPLNARHGRAPQLALWGLVPDSLSERAVPTLLVVEDSARPLKARLQGYRDLCARTGALPPPEVLNVDTGRKRFLLFALDPAPATDAVEDCALPALAWIDAPARRARVPGRFEVAGWAFKDGVGLARVEITLDGRVVATARYGEAMPHVAEYWKISRDPNHPRVGFRARIDAGGVEPGRHHLGLILHGADGSVEPWPAQPITIDP